MIAAGFYAQVAAAVAAVTESVFPHVIPADSTMPAVTYSIADDARQQLFDAVSSLKIAEFNVDCWSPSYAEATSLADLIEAALVGYRGELGDYEADHVRMDRRFDLFESQTEFYRVSMRYVVAYSDA